MAEFVEVMKQRKRMCNDCILDDLCDDCPIEIINLLSNPEKAQAFIMKWASEHPVKTNADKFKEVFGYEIYGAQSGCCGIKYTCPTKRCDGCELKGFWNKEYAEPKENSNG